MKNLKIVTKSVNYVYQMFSDIALLVHNQAEDLDNIELNLNKAKDYLEKAEKTLVKAKAEHQKTRKVLTTYIYLNFFFNFM